MKTLSQHSHLKKTSENREMHNCLRGLTVVSGSKSGYKRKQRCHKWGTLPSKDVRWPRVGMVSQQFNAGYNAVLTKRKSLHWVIASWAQPPSTLIALNHRRIFRMVATVHHLTPSSPQRLFCPSMLGLAAGLVGSFCSSTFSF